ncbi:MAG: hypothetical protein AAB422_05360 [Planctomycetota bacterium]
MSSLSPPHNTLEIWGHDLNSPEFRSCPQISGQNHEQHQHKSSDHRGDKDAEKIIQPDIPPGHFVDSEDKERADFHRHKERQDGKNEGVVPGVQVQIEMKQKCKKQRHVKKNDIRQEKEEKLFPGGRM